MRLRYCAWVLPAMALGAFVAAGCSPSNEEGFAASNEKGVRKEGMPDFKSYAEVQQYQTKQAALNRPAGKGKAAPKAAPTPSKDEPKAKAE